MKLLKLTATQLSDLQNVIDKLTPAQAAQALPDVNALEASRIRKKLVKKMKEANRTFLDECQKSFDEKTKIVDRYQKEYQDRGDGMEAEDEKDFGASLTNKMRAEVDVVDKASKANAMAPVVTELELGNDDLKSLKALYPATAGFWVSPDGRSVGDTFVDIGDGIDAAENA